MNQASPHVLLDEPPNPINEEQRDLWCSVIQQAVEDFRGCNDPADKDSHHHKRLRYEDAKRWLESDNTCPNSFLALCDLLGLDPGAIRHRLFTEKKNSNQTTERRDPSWKKKRNAAFRTVARSPSSLAASAAPIMTAGATTSLK